MGTLRLVQFEDEDSRRCVGLVEGGRAHLLASVRTLYQLAKEAIETGRGLSELAESRAEDWSVELDQVEAEGRLLPPLDHPDPAHFLITGTGLTHLGSAEGRDRMHKKLEGNGPLTDSMKMFKLGIEGGKPGPGGVGVQPEWFYKGDGSIVVRPGDAFPLPDWALDGGEEAEIVGLYLNGPDGTPWRLGFALGNEFSDHVMERQNYLYLAHSKLRACAFGPELLVGDLPADLRGKSRVLREGQVLWEQPFLTGEENMSHSLDNLERHHFKYPLFRRPGDAHAHFFGAATLSFADGVSVRPGDLFEIAVAEFGRPLRNGLEQTTLPRSQVQAL